MQPLPLTQPRALSDAIQVLSNPDAYADSPTLIHMAQLCVMSAGGMPATQRNCNRDRSDLSDWQRFLIAQAAKDERARLAALRQSQLRAVQA